jgi:sugar lactone lactonase YvrE
VSARPARLRGLLFLAVVPVALAWATPAAATDYQFERRWAVDRPLSVAVGPQGTVYVAGRDAIHTFSGSGAPSATWDDGGGAEGLAVDAQGTVYAADYAGRRIRTFTSAGTPLAEWPIPGAPNDVAIGPDGSVFVVDTANDGVARFSPDGRVLGAWGRSGAADGELAVPWGIAVDGAGVVYVSERDNDRVQRFRADGTFLGALTRAGSGPGATRTPDGIAIGPQGNAYVADSGNFRLQELTPAGTFAGQVGERGWGEGELDEPRDVAFDVAGNVYVADHGTPADGIVKYAPRRNRRAKQIRLTRAQSGGRVTLTARVAPCGAARTANGERVIFERRRAGRWRRVGAGRAAGPRCEARLRITPASTRRYRARSPRSASLDGARSTALRIRVR